MSDQQKSPQTIFEENIHPYKQAGVTIGVAVVLLILGALMKSSGVDLPERFSWMCAGASMMLFAIFNSILSVSAKNSMKYWGDSMVSYFAVMVVSGLLAWLISGMSIYEAGTFKWIFGVITVVYLVFISIMNALKKIVSFAQKEEWNQPRLRSRKSKKKKDN